MTVSDNFYIGTGPTDLYDFFPLSYWLPNGDEPIAPDWTFSPFSETIRLASNNVLGVGFPHASWSWNAIRDENIEILRENFCPYPAASANVYIRTPTLELSGGLYVWKTFACKLIWPIEENREAIGTSLDLTLEFIKLVEQ